MKREIKFRAWDREDLRMVERPFVVSNEGKAFDEYRGGGYVKQYTLMQFTGLLDKNGKEIYEGDIVNVFDDIGADPAYGQKFDRFTVKVQDYAFMAFLETMVGETEIIGNIYEHSELLANKEI